MDVRLVVLPAGGLVGSRRVVDEDDGHLVRVELVELVEVVRRGGGPRADVELGGGFHAHGVLGGSANRGECRSPRCATGWRLRTRRGIPHARRGRRSARRWTRRRRHARCRKGAGKGRRRASATRTRRARKPRTRRGPRARRRRRARAHRPRASGNARNARTASPGTARTSSRTRTSTPRRTQRAPTLSSRARAAPSRATDPAGPPAPRGCARLERSKLSW